MEEVLTRQYRHGISEDRIFVIPTLFSSSYRPPTISDVDSAEIAHFNLRLARFEEANVL
ncbi:hypothetical protein M378DRAFT_167902, partial [Amanita muscaria Koide BX008]